MGAFSYSYVGLTGMLARLDLPNGMQTVQSYDGLQRLTQVVNQKSNGTALNQFAYAYDTRDVRTAVQQKYGSDPLRQVNYAYDATDQLKTESASGGLANTNYSNAFSYDSMGNRTFAQNTSGGSTQETRLTPNALNQISALSQSRNGATPVNSGFVYDAAGNTKQVENADGGKTLFDYDDADRLVRIETRNGADVPVTRSEFVYDYASRKAVSKEFTWTAGAWVKTGETRRVFDGLDVVQERNAANEVTAQLVRDGNIGGILSRSTAAGASFFGYDGGGNVTLLTDENGNDVGRYRYDAFGNTLEVSGARAAENPYRFSTKELHAASGLYDFGFRFYSAGLGRWINRDPIRESGGINLYAMVGNSPTNGIDAYGLILDTIADIGFVGYDIYTVVKDPRNGTNWLSLLADTAAAFLPFITGAGVAVRATSAGAKAAKAAKAAQAAKAAGVVIIGCRVRMVPGLMKAFKRLPKNSVQEAERLIEAFAKGNANPGIGNGSLKHGGIFYLRGRNGARVFMRNVDGLHEILAYADKSNESAVIKILMSVY